ncbi:hypothetical protein AGR2A_pa40139 [Agrobacterium genomosp. 2 str. CFBP 5494]|uniref:Uncharacterized protein n=1 Tax=Agrobacterium genomosp. 2 str. CFBP 5494 TaxID=1183436 RepID=A0A9W5B6X8_9HYPH|nr:hypothetical protein AGR2A_pa40139 [Agrobacterium genomosp. 2 str. CFBP 5494]
MSRGRLSYTTPRDTIAVIPTGVPAFCVIQPGKASYSASAAFRIPTWKFCHPKASV